jgi:hypothetical protein
MKIYLDQSIIDEWLKFKSKKISFADYGRDADKTSDIIRNLEAFGKILDIRSITFLYSSLNELESSALRKNLFNDLVCQDGFVKVPAVGLRICMVDQELPKENILEIGVVQSYFASYIRKFGSKNMKDRNDFMKYMRRKFFDPMHIDSAIKAAADIFLTIDIALLNSIKNYPDLQTFLTAKIKVFTPYEYIQQVTTRHGHDRER